MNATPRLSGLQKSRCLLGGGAIQLPQASSRCCSRWPQKCSGDAVRRCAMVTSRETSGGCLWRGASWLLVLCRSAAIWPR
jgi:hypothetical protein